LALCLSLLGLLLCVPGAAEAHTVLYFTGLTDLATSWQEGNFVVEGFHSTDGGGTSTPAHLHSDSWTQGNDYAYGHESDANWIVFTAPGDLLTPISFYIARRSGSQEFVSSSGAQVAVSGTVGDLFNFPTTSDWSDLDWVALHVTSGELGMDNFTMYACPDPTIPGPFNVSEGGGTIVFGSIENPPVSLNWDLDGDGQFDDGIGVIAAFDATDIDGPATIPIALEATANCGAGGDLTSSVGSEVQVVNVAPTIDNLWVPDAAFEGQELSLEVEFSDPAAADTHTLDWDFGDSVTAAGTNTTESHSYVDEGAYTVAITVTDDDGGSDATTRVIDVANVAPSIDSIAIPDGLEGEGLSFVATVSDPGIDDVLSYAWDFGDGGSATGLNASHSYDDDGSYQVTFTADDGDGGISEEIQSATISNVAPTVDSLSLPATANEGEVVALDASATDPGADVVTWVWDFGDGSPGSSGTPVSHSWGDEGSYTVVATANDGDEGVGTHSAVIEVLNVSPSITSLDLPGATEGSAVVLSAVVADPGADTLVVSWDLGDGTTATGTSVTHVYSDEGTHAINVQVSDGDGGSDSQTGTVLVTNAAPEIGSLTGNTTGQEAQLLSWTVVASDPGSGDSLSYAWDFGDGDTASSGTTQQHSYSTSDTFSVTITVSDEDGGSTSASLSVLISDEGPNITSVTSSAGEEGAPITLSGDATNPGSDTLTFSWDPGDGSEALIGDTVTHTYQDDGIYTATLDVTDSDGLVSSATVAVVVSNASPTLGAPTIPSEALEGETLSFSASASDPSSTDSASLSFSWAFGDGSAPQSGAAVSHAFSDDGSYVVTVTVSDPDGGLDSQNSTVQVSNVSPTITSSPTTTALVGTAYDYQPVATDPGDSQFTWSLGVSAPPGMTIDASTGAVNWTPDDDDALTGTVAITLQVDDGDGGLDLQSWTIEISQPDSDGDGITDNWETLNGLDPNDFDDGTADPDADGRSNLDEFQDGTDPNDFDGPGVPELLEPVEGQEVGTSTPDLVVSNPENTAGLVLEYEFEVYADPDLTQFMSAASEIVEGDDGTTTWKVDVALPESTLLYWRCRASDPWVAGPYSDVSSFVVDAVEAAPPTPGTVYPVAGEAVGQTYPEFLWSPVIDVDGDIVTYSVEIRELESQAVVLLTAGIEDDGADVTASWQAPVVLIEDSWYEWSVMAVDETGLESAWSPSESFFYSVQNASPSSVAWLEPESGAELVTLSPDLVVAEGLDPDGVILEYLFETDLVPEFGSDDYQSVLLEATGTGTVVWSLEDDALELPENSHIYARVRAFDDEGLASVPATIDFFTRGEEEAPPQPQLLAPEDGTEDLEVAPVLVASQVEDPDGDLVFYEFIVARDESLEDIVTHSPSVLGGAGPGGGVDTTSWTVTSPLPHGQLYWSARGLDSRGSVGAWAAPYRFSLANEPAVAEPSTDCNCTGARMVNNDGVSAEPSLLLLVLLAGLQRRRRPGMHRANHNSTVIAAGKRGVDIVQ